ncbi:MAG: UvrD-helicase domain-containing protein [Pirellulaceae bacterium]
MTDRITDLESLNPAQREAVCHLDGPLLILAGPGSGKTRVVTHRVAHLIEHGVDPRAILALTFTNKAADEMRERIGRLAPGANVWLGTFHRFCARLLRQHAELAGLAQNYSIYDAGESHSVLVQTIRDSDQDLSHFTPDNVARAIAWAKQQLIGPDEYEPRHGNPLGAIVSRIYPEYERRLLAANAVDFDNLLYHVARLLRDNDELRRRLDARYRYILVDEYQDTNFAQYAIVRAMSIDHPNLAVTGDPDQSIYGWRGANLNNILDFEHDFEGVRIVRLEQNYRSTKRILRVADCLIAHNKRRKQKRLFTDNDEGRLVRYVNYANYRDEADDIAARIAFEVQQGRRRLGDFAIFYRTNALSRSLEHALQAQGLAYQIVNAVEFYQRAEIKDLVAYLHLINNPRDDVALLRVINKPTRGIGKRTVERLRRFALEEGTSILDAARKAGLVEGLSKRATLSVAKFVAMLDRMSLSAGGAVKEVLDAVLAETGYRDMFAYSEDEEDQQRVANIDELLAAADEFDRQHPYDGGLERYLEQAALAADTDAWEGTSDRVSLMTLHSAKGLEFPVVYLIAVEHGQLPHERSIEDPEQLEEERRLLFVGITRAREELQLSRAMYRYRRGRPWPTVPSSFITELPTEELEKIEPIRPSGAPAAEQAVWTDDEFMQDGPVGDDLHDDAHDNAVAQRQRGAVPVMPGVTTAARMLAGAVEVPQGLERPSPDSFHEGMQVVHPNYGSGEITALGGTDSRRTATVRFFESEESMTFCIAFSPLRPAD